MNRQSKDLKFPHNLLFDIFGEDEFNNLPAKARENIYIFYNFLLFSNDGFSITKQYYIQYECNIQRVASKTGYSENRIRNKLEKLLSILRENKDAITKDFYESEFYKKAKVNEELHKIGFNINTIKVLNKCHIFSLKPILQINTITELVELILKYNIDRDNEIGDIVENILKSLNANGYNTVKFGYYGKFAKDTQFTGEEVGKDRIKSQELIGKDELEIEAKVNSNSSIIPINIKCPRCYHETEINVELDKFTTDSKQQSVIGYGKISLECECVKCGQRIIVSNIGVTQ